MRIRYQELTISPAHQKVIDQANTIIGEYETMGISLTLRSIYYQFVSRDLIPNKQSEYKRLGSILNRGRLAGLVSWRALEDITRNITKEPSWNDIQDYFGTVPGWYHEDLWHNQPCRVIVGIEKDAGLNTIARVCQENDVPYISCRGYMSQSEEWALGRRFRGYAAKRQRPMFLYVGDHDPSGVDMTRDHEGRLAMFASYPVEVRRLALNLDQIDEYDPPPNPVKSTDSRSGKEDDDTGEFTPGSYRQMMLEHGREPDCCWELDALNPAVIVQLIQDAIDEVRDPELWTAAQEEQEASRGRLSAFLDTYDPERDYADED